MRRVNYLLLAFFFGLLSASPEAVAKARKVTATGKCVQEEHMTGNQAVDFARRRAKEEALRTAGIEERVWSLFGIMSSSDQNNPAFFDAWAETSFALINGMVRVLDEDVKMTINESGYIEREVTIVAEVEEDQKMDPTYQLKVDDVADVCDDLETVRFNYCFYNYDSYVKVFYFNDVNAALIYPEGYMLEDIFNKGEDQSFILRLHKNPEDKTAYINVLFVVTKRNYPFTTKPTAQNIMQWLSRIPADERAVEMKTIMIR